MPAFLASNSHSIMHHLGHHEVTMMCFILKKAVPLGWIPPVNVHDISTMSRFESQTKIEVFGSTLPETNSEFALEARDGCNT